MEKKDQQLIYGRHPVLDAIRAGQPFEKLILQQGVRGEFEKELRQLSKANNIPMQVVPKERLNKLVRGNHQGVVGVLSPIRYYLLEDVLPTIYERSEVPLILLLDGVTDVRNLGAIARSAELAGVHALVVPRKGSAQINAEALKTSAGALTRIPVCRESSLVAAVETLRLSGIPLIVSDLQAKQLVFEIDFTGPVALVVGAEGRGVSWEMVQAATRTFLIPQRGTTDSFNVSVAAGIMLYEVMRQRMETGNGK